MSEHISEQDLPGIGRRFDLICAEGERVRVVIGAYFKPEAAVRMEASSAAC